MRAAMMLLTVCLIGSVATSCATTGASVSRKAAEPRPYGYTLSGPNVVFAFRPEEYASVTSGATGEWVPMKELRINSVAVAGEFNRWSTDAWPLARSGEGWIATRPIAEFEQVRPQQFKFVINGRFWAEPPTTALNRITAPDETRVTNLMLQINNPSWQPVLAAPHKKSVTRMK